MALRRPRRRSDSSAAMLKLTGPHPHQTGRGFMLVELLLTLVLLLLLASAAVISFSTLLSGSELEEGAMQMEGLMRFARAHALNTGKKVQIVFEEQTSDSMTAPLGNVRVLWEVDPVRFPGQMTALGESVAMVQNVNNLVQVKDVRAIGETDSTPVDHDQFSFAPLTFYPDGSSESTEIILASRAQEETRRISIRITGITGVIRRDWMAQAGEADTIEEELFP